MDLDIDIQVAWEGACNHKNSNNLPTPTDFNRWVSAALRGEREAAELSIRIVGAPESREFNHRYRGQDKPTNILSFPAELPAGVNVPLLGDLVVCAPIVFQEASAQNKTPAAHWAHMVVHGTLHLLGYDHIDDTDAETMERLETEILTGLNYPAPYTEILLQ